MARSPSRAAIISCHTSLIQQLRSSTTACTVARDRDHQHQLAMALYARGLEYRKIGDYSTAIADFTESIKTKERSHQPPPGTFFLERGIALWSLKRYNEAIADLIVARKDQSTAARAGQLLGIAFLSRGKKHQARGALNSAIGDFNLAICLLKRGRDIPQIVSTDDHLGRRRLAEAYFCRAQCSDEKGQTLDAIKDLSKGLKLHPRHVGARLHRAHLFLTASKLDFCIADASKILHHDEVNFEAFVCRGLAYRRKGEAHKADQDFTMARRLNPEAFARIEPGLTLARKLTFCSLEARLSLVTADVS